MKKIEKEKLILNELFNKKLDPLTSDQIELVKFAISERIRDTYSNFIDFTDKVAEKQFIEDLTNSIAQKIFMASGFEKVRKDLYGKSK